MEKKGGNNRERELPATWCAWRTAGPGRGSGGGKYGPLVHRRSAMRKATNKPKTRKDLKLKNLPAKGRKAATVKAGGLATRAGGEVISAD